MRHVVVLISLLAPGIAWADPCEGRLPTGVGTPFSGQVRYVVDGDGLCVGPTADPATWIEVRISDFNAPELGKPGGAAAKDALVSIAMNQPAECIVQRGRSGRTRSYDRVFAVCRVGGRSVGEAMRAVGIVEGGN